MRIEQRKFSPACIDKIVSIDGQVKSSGSARKVLMKAAEISVSTSVIREYSTTVGTELQRSLAEQAQKHAQGTLEAEKPEPPSVVAVAVDGGRIMTRESGEGRGVHAPGWKESKDAQQRGAGGRSSSRTAKLFCQPSSRGEGREGSSLPLDGHPR